MPTLTTSLQVRTLADRFADWTQPLSFLQFDPSLGTLRGIHFGLTGDVAASAAIENLGSAPATVTVSIPGAISLIGPDNVFIARVQPIAAASTTSLAAFDGTKDYSGASGTTLAGLSDTQSTDVFSQADLAAFIGTGNVVLSAAASIGLSETGTLALPISSLGQSTISASTANLLTELTTEAGATVNISYTYLPIPAQLSLAGIASSDFSGAGHADIVWQNDDGTPAIWELNGTSYLRGVALSNPGPNWHFKASGDFNGDGKANIVWQNDNGSVAAWQMDGTSYIGGTDLGNPGTSWHVKATGDFSGDGKSDILWQNDDGSVAI